LSTANAGHKGLVVSIQLLRAVAAYLVVVVHIGGLFKGSGLDGYFHITSCGVDIFFVISGFIMVYTTSQNPGMSAGEFLRHRLARVVPSYWLLTGALFLLGQVGRVQLSGTQVTGEHLLKSLFFIPYARLDGRMEPLLFVGWSLNYEMAFYLAFALAMVGRGRIAHLRWLAGAMVALVLSRALPFDLPRELHFYRAPILLDFVYGMVLARYYMRMPVGRLWSRMATVVLVSGFLAMLGLQIVATGMVASLGGGLLAALVVGAALQIELAGRWPRWRFGESMGNASYALYLTHPFVVSAVAMVLHHMAVQGAVGPVAGAGLVLVGSTVVALLYYRHVEKLLSKLVLGRRKRRDARVGDAVVTG
jgi:peptidoglycan/LPS O-acetylase OafA/YrhL